MVILFGGPFRVNSPGHVAEHNRLAQAVPDNVTAVAPLASPALTGSPTAPTPPVGDSSGSIATTEFTQSAISALAVLPMSGLLWGFLGDSITHGSNASNFSYAYHSKAVGTVGGLVARPDFVESGVPGQTSANMLARVQDTLNAGIQALVVLAGTNDAGLGVPVATFAANITGIVAAAKSRGIPVVLCTVPPRSASTSAAVHQLLHAYNIWITTFAPALGVQIADAYTALADPTTGCLPAAFDSGDGTHPNDGGHNAMSVPVARAMKAVARRQAPYGLVTSISPDSYNLVSDALVNIGTGKPSGWFEWPGGTGTAPAYAPQADTSGVLPAGRWAQMDFDATTSGGTRILSSNAFNTSNWSVGDWIAITAHLQVIDVSGTWVADVVAGTASVDLSVVNQGASVIAGSRQTYRLVGLTDAPGVYNIGPVVAAFQIPAGTTGMNLWMSVKLPTGKHIQARIGAVGALELTKLGIDGMFSGWASVARNVT